MVLNEIASKVDLMQEIQRVLEQQRFTFVLGFNGEQILDVSNTDSLYDKVYDVLREEQESLARELGIPVETLQPITPGKPRM